MTHHDPTGGDPMRGPSAVELTEQETTREQITKRLTNIDRALGNITTGQNRLTQVMAGLLTLTIGVAITFGILFKGAAEHRTELQRAIIELERVVVEQDITRGVALCPLFRILTSLESPAGRERYPFGPDAYDRDVSQLRLGYTSLECAR